VGRSISAMEGHLLLLLLLLLLLRNSAGRRDLAAMHLPG